MNRLAQVSRRAALLGAGACVLARAADAQDGGFYRGRTITFFVGSDPGGGYDLLARLVARHIGQFIPGRPNVIVENMPGAGSLLLSNRIYNTAPRDGTVIGLVQRGVMLAAVTGQPGARFDLDRFNWIGSITSERSLMAVWSSSPVRSFADLQQREVAVGGTGPTSDTEASARLLNGVSGTKLKIVSGYPGTADVLLAMQRGELDGIADLSWSELKAKNAALLARGDLRFIALHGEHRIADLPDVPSTLDYISSPDGREVARIYYMLKDVARPLLAGPGIPPDRMAMLRAAFTQMTSDPAYLADAAQNRLDLVPLGPDAIEQFFAEVRSSSPQVKQLLKRVLNPDAV